MFSSIIGGGCKELKAEELVLRDPGALLANLTHLGITLPSDSDWRNENYFRLVQLHRCTSDDVVLPTKYKHVPQTDETLPDKQLCGTRHDGNDGEIVCTNTWTHEDLILADSLLSRSEISRTGVVFQGADLEQTRRVITLVFNILRFKPLLKEALDDNKFFEMYPEFQSCPWKVWLLLYDLYRRDFQQRDKFDPEHHLDFEKNGLAKIDETLWNNKVTLAATISRLRIKRTARTIEDLLPPHLQLSHQIMNKTLIGGWINTFKTDVQSFVAAVKRELGLRLLETPSLLIPKLFFGSDHLVPRYIHCHSNECADILLSNLVSDRFFIIQDTSQCLGAVTFLKVMEELELCGSVAQTHMATPPSTAYLASLIAHNPNIDQLLIFSTGSKKTEYEEYFREIGAFNITLFSEHFSEITPENTVLHNIIAVMACPPSSNTAVRDPVNLALARGGDVSVLYALTEDYYNECADIDIAKQQRNTLLKAMSMPQIQAILYESYSRSAEENENMVYSAVDQINQWAADRHWEESLIAHGSPTLNEQDEPETASVESATIEEAVVQVPMCDLYEIAALPDLCPNESNCSLSDENGVYLALLKRKEITRLDPKYMISMAEIRGLFGRQVDATIKTQKKKAVKTRSLSWKESTPTKPLIELDRLSAPTLASKHKDIRMSGEVLECERFAVHIRNAFCDDGLLARLWWKTLLNYIRRNMHRKSKFPTLRLRRALNSINKDAFPTHYASIDLGSLLMNAKRDAFTLHL